MSTTADTTLVMTPVATLSYPHIHEPQPPQPGSTAKPKYSAVFVFPAGTDLSALKAAALAAATEKWGAKGAARVTVGGKGSTFRSDVEGKYPEGSIYISARSEQKPGAVYRWAGPDGKKPATIENEKLKDVLYPGAQVRGQLRAFAYDKAGNIGVSFALNNIQKMGEGERLDNRQDAADAFDADLSAVPADLKELMS
jgi:hypothetical protein